MSRTIHTRSVHLAALGLLTGCLGLVGCTSVNSATEDHTQLKAREPSNLARILEVIPEGMDPELAADLLAALRQEFEARDLFDLVSTPPERPVARRVSRLHVELVEHTTQEVFYLYEWEDAYVARYELEVQLLDAAEQPVLTGRVSGVGVDAVTDADSLTEQRREDVRLAALQDAATKVSAFLRQSSDARARAAMDELQEIQLPPGFGPVHVAVLGFDDPPSARLRRGPVLRGHVIAALERLGPDIKITDDDEVARALDHSTLKVNQLIEVDQVGLAPLALELPSARVFVVGAVVSSGGVVRVQVRVLDRTGQPLFAGDDTEAGPGGAVEHRAEGLGALRVVAASMVGGLADELQADPPAPN
jgi:hypothetical protein